MARQIYNTDFKLFMEGVEVPFMSVTISSNPNGNEASINLPADKNIFSLKPKTCVQLFFKEWYKSDEDAGWRLCFDGYYSGLYEIVEVGKGKAFTIICRDVRMDIRKSPAALAFEPDSGEGVIETERFYNYMGLFHTWVARGYTPKKTPGQPIVNYGTILNEITYVIAYFAGAASGEKAKPSNTIKGEFSYSSSYGGGIAPKNYTEPPKCGLFFDSIVRGLWLESVGGTTVNAFMNKRARLDKKVFIPRNIASYRFWRTQSAGASLGNFLMGNARFTSVEAAICRTAAIFQMKISACCTPSMINIDDNSLANEFVIDEDVRKFLVKRGSAEYGPPFLLNEMMFLPPLDFTAPPNCNLLFPPLYSRFTWQHDFDVDITRGRFDQTEVFGGENGSGLHAATIQVPNALFDINRQDYKDDVDYYNRRKPPITMQERYSGVNVFFDSVDYLMAARDANENMVNNSFPPDKKNALLKAKKELEDRINELNSSTNTNISSSALIKLQEKYQQTQKAIDDGEKKRIPANTDNYLKRHAVLKFINAKYGGRVASIDMQFNPFLLNGFPIIVFADSNDFEKNISKDVIGTIQQIQHQIVISTQSGDFTTSIVINNARYVDEPTDMDPFGSPLYMKATNRDIAIYDINKFKYQSVIDGLEKTYLTPTPKSSQRLKPIDNTEDILYDLEPEIPIKNEGYVYAKDLLTVSDEDFRSGKHTNMYLDESYEPNRIDEFYRKVFKLGLSFMVGNEGGNYFMFDTIHEAVEELKKNKDSLLTDYDDAVNYIYREICSADALFHGLYECSILGSNNTYINKVTNFDPKEIKNRYFGITQYKMTNLGDKCPRGLIPGIFSTVRENMPVTAFLQERRRAVEEYYDHVTSSNHFVRSNG
jgi:hypothetical protein